MENKQIQITYNNKTTLVNKNTTVSEIFDNQQYIAARVNNQVTSLSYQLTTNAKIEPITIDSSIGMTIYRRSLTFLLSKVVSEIFPTRRLHIGHSIGAGYFFDLDGDTLTDSDIQKIKTEMNAQIQANKKIESDVISYTDAIDFLKSKNRFDKLNLLTGINSSILPIYKCDNYIEIFDGPLAQRTGILTVFDLIKYKSGFIIQFPSTKDIKKIVPFVAQDKVFEIYKSSKQITHSLNVDNIGDLNNLVVSKQFSEFVQMSETLQFQNIYNLSKNIMERKDAVKLITIAGPSSSGKTTFSKRLTLQLKTLGLKPVTISIDDYYVDRVRTPKDENGNYDFECLEALNVEMLNENLKDLIAGKTVYLPIYNFQTGVSSIREESVQLGQNEVIIIEGIHGLNDKLTYSIDANQKYKIYISALTQINIDDNNRIPTSDNRLMRRIVRDYKYRGYSAQKTISMWPSVRNGEEKYIFPFQNNADGYFNSALNYELAALKPFIKPLLIQIKPNEPEYAEAVRLLNLLKYFVAVDSSMIPATSIMREFIGGSFFHY